MPRYEIPNPAPEPLRLVQSFVNTRDLERDHDWLETPADLSNWLREHGYGGKATRADLRRARDLREALRTLLVANNASDRSPEEAWQSLNATATSARLTPRFEPTGDVVVEPQARGVAAALGGVVAIVFLAALDGSFSRLKACRNCRWAFYDYSRNRGASWCSMSLCGNRLKTRRYRARHAPTPRRS